MDFPSAQVREQEQHLQQQQQQKQQETLQQQPHTNETASLMNDFGLVAEAVKRAEMAIMMRDMEGVELT